MKITALLLLSLLTTPTFAATRARGKKSGENNSLPPKFGGLLQPVPALAPGAQQGLFTSDLGGRDLEFLTTALEDGRVQVWLCKSAREKAETDQVRAVGDALESTQAQENGYLSKLAARKGVVLASITTSPAQQKLDAELSPLSGPRFDKAVMEQIITTAQRSVTAYEGAARSSDADIKGLAERLLPVAKDKLLLANKISGRAQETNLRPGFRTSAPAAAPAPTALAAPEAATAPPPSAGAAPARPAGPKPLPVGSR